MFNRPYVAAALLAALTLLPVAPAFAVDGEVLITHAKALAGNVTPGDTAGYPVTVSIPGRFKLASNLFVAANKIGIQVTGANATIDLNGFTMRGSDVAWYGITGGAEGVTVENGTITGFRFDGINSPFSFWIVDNMRSIRNGRDGIVLGTYALIKSSVVALNDARGIKIGTASVIQGNTVSLNGGFGVDTIQSAVIGNAINDNGSYGLNGSQSGYASNILRGNYPGINIEVYDVIQMHPNVCTAGSCP